MDKLILKSLKSAREEAGLTQKEVEQKLSLRKLLMKDYETGRIKLPVEVALRLSDLYCISLDELICHRSHSKNLAKLEIIFSKGHLDLIYLDPIIRGEVETYSDKIFEKSLYEILITGLDDAEKEAYHKCLIGYLYSLIGVDGKILQSELTFVSSIIHFLNLKLESDHFKDYLTEPISYDSLPSVLLKNLHLRHFIIWVLFFLAKSDGEVTTEELVFIEDTSEKFKILKSSFLLIKDLFIKEDL